MSQSSQSKARPTNIPSLLLQQNENEALFQIIGKSCVTLASAVVQLYLADQPDRTKWNKRTCGVVCFIKDNAKRSYFIRVFDLKSKQQVWEQELYNSFRYKTPREYFHTFEAHTCMVGLNFASEDEALKFKNVVEGKLQYREQRKRERKVTKQPNVNANQASKQIGNPSSQSSLMQPQMSTSVDLGSRTDNNNVGLSKKDKKKDKSKKLTKADIGQPTAFRHVSHVGWDPNKGFDMNNLDPDMQTLFNQVGISSDDQVDKDTVDFIYDFVEKHGGMEVLKKEMKQRPPPPPPPSGSKGSLPPPPQRSAAVPPPPSRNAVPPPPPNRGPATPTGGRAPAVAQQPPPPPSRGVLPTPPKAPGAAPPPPPNNAPRSVPTPSGNKGMAAPFIPAPPPLMPSGGAIPPPPPPPPLPDANDGDDMGGGGGRSALLQAIQAGKKLKPVDSAEAPAGRSADSRGLLLDAIRQGANLKPVEDQDDRRSLELNTDAQDGIVGALARALAQRRPACVDSDEDDSNEEDDDDDMDDDEWDD